MQHSGLSSATAEFDADRLSLCELVCRSACGGSHHDYVQTGEKVHNTTWTGISSLQYLHQNVFYYLVAVIMYAYVTGEGLTEEYVSVRCEDKNVLHTKTKEKEHFLLFNFKELAAD